MTSDRDPPAGRCLEEHGAELIRDLGRLRGLLKVLATAPAAGGGPDAVLREALAATDADAGALVRLAGADVPEPLAAQGVSPAAAGHLATRPAPAAGAPQPEQTSSVTVPLRLGDEDRGVLVLLWNRPRSLTEQDRVLLDVLADLVTVGLDAASFRERLVASATDITARRRSVEQASGLAALARRLNASSTVTEVADTICKHAAGAFGGRHATLALREPGTGTTRLFPSPSTPEHFLRESSRESSLPRHSPNHIARCIRTAATVVVTDPVTLDDAEGSAEELDRLRAGRIATGVTVSVAKPLVGTDGDVLGALATGWPRVGDLDEERLARMQTVAEMCVQAIERARLTDAHVVADRRSRALSSLAQQLASAVTLDEVWQAVARGAPPVVGARSAVLGLVDSDGSALIVRYPADVPATVARRGRRQPLATHRPQTDAFRTGEPVFLPTAAEHERRYPGLLARLAEVGLQGIVSTAALPLRDNADRIIGTLAFGWTAAAPFGPVLHSTLDTIAELCGQTLERARLHAAEHELVEGLQRRLLRPMPTVPGLTAHALYRAAQTSVGIGGDFHDGVVLPGGRLAVVLGDVAGHGMEAAADMAQLRTLLSTLLAAGIPLDRLFPQADAALDQVAALSLATAVAAVVDPAARTLSYVHAGHPPLVLRRPDGVTAPLTDGRGGLLGVGIAVATPATVPFEPGSVLLGYTDGLVEVRGAAIDNGIEAAVAATADVSASHPGLDAARIASAVLDRCLGARRLTDDVALLVVSYPPDGGTS